MNVVLTIVLALQMLAALGMIGLILVQHGKGADMGAAFGSGGSGSLFGASGSANFLSRTTGVLAAVFLPAPCCWLISAMRSRAPAPACWTLPLSRGGFCTCACRVGGCTNSWYHGTCSCPACGSCATCSRRIRCCANPNEIT